MGHGTWTRDSFVSYSTARGRTVNANGTLNSSLTDRQLFVQRNLHPGLNPLNVMRECCDTAEHPNTVPVILALDVTGSMGAASAEVAKKLNEVMTLLYHEVRDVEFMVMGIGDLAYDCAPIQISQFESDIRIAEQLDQIFMEHGGGGNGYESYTAAWYMGLHHTRPDCWKRGQKGLLITMGDEPLNPYLPRAPLSRATGDALESDVETGTLYRQAVQKYDIHHLHVTHTLHDRYLDEAQRTFGKYLPEDHLRFVSVDSIAAAIVDIVKQHAKGGEAFIRTTAKPEKNAKPGILDRLIHW